MNELSGPNPAPAGMPALQTWRSAPRGAGILSGNGDFPVAGAAFEGLSQ
jgi:hypothetical protein